MKAFPRLAAGAMVVLALLPACGGTDRPEGVVERWLISLNQGAAGRPGRYAPEAVSEQILPGWRQCDPGALDVTEVGKGTVIRTGGPGGANQGSGEAVPYRVVYASNIDSLCRHAVRATGLLQGIANLSRSTREWRVVDVYRPPPSVQLPRVPSEGGQRVGGATFGQWLAGIGVGVALALLVVALMRFAPKPAPLPQRE